MNDLNHPAGFRIYPGNEQSGIMERTSTELIDIEK